MAGMNRLIMTRRIRLLAIAAVLASAAACTINPVTGQRQLALISAQDEVALGEQHYAPTRQMQGGDFVLDPELARYVASVGQRLAAVSDRDLPYEFAVLNSSVPNAWALPGGKIAINRGLLLELDSEAELAAVLGHEIVHAAARHSALAMQRGMLLQIPVLVGAVAAQRSNFGGLAVGAAAVGAQLIGQRYGRAAELESDEYGMEYMSRAGYDPQAAVSLQETFLRLSGGRDDQGWLAGLFASHPPSGERVEQNRRTAARLQAGGEVGRERYQAAIATLRSTQPAYDAHDQGRAALADGQLSDAERLAAEALRLEPREGHFHALMGDVEFQRQNWRAAANRYGDAIARNDRFFYYHLRQGLARQRLGESQAAEVSLEASVRLLPTADAYFALGQLAEQRGEPYRGARALSDRSRLAEPIRTGRAGRGRAPRPAAESRYLSRRWQRPRRAGSADRRSREPYPRAGHGRRDRDSLHGCRRRAPRGAATAVGHDQRRRFATRCDRTRSIHLGTGDRDRRDQRPLRQQQLSPRGIQSQPRRLKNQNMPPTTDSMTTQISGYP
jgi:beta-barrel assembly-enhancing protease